jgi:hypothetical protein
VPFEIQLTESLFVASRRDFQEKRNEINEESRIIYAAADSYFTADLIPSSAAAGEDGDWYLPTSVWMTRLATVLYSRQPAAIHLLSLAIMRSIRADLLPLPHIPRYVCIHAWCTKLASFWPRIGMKPNSC